MDVGHRRVEGVRADRLWRLEAKARTLVNMYLLSAYLGMVYIILHHKYGGVNII